jgi:hypothetical protein
MRTDKVDSFESRRSVIVTFDGKLLRQVSEGDTLRNYTAAKAAPAHGVCRQSVSLASGCAPGRITTVVQQSLRCTRTAFKARDIDGGGP